MQVEDRNWRTKKAVGLLKSRDQKRRGNLESDVIENNAINEKCCVYLCMRERETETEREKTL